MKIETDKQGIVRRKKAEGAIAPSSSRVRRSFLAKKLVIKGENRKEFEELRAKVLREILPNTEMENILCERFISAAWKLQRAMEIEKNLLNEQNAISEHERYGSATPRERVRNIKKVRLNGPDIQYLIHYQLELEKAMQKALERLRAEQALRNAQVPIRHPVQEV